MRKHWFYFATLFVVFATAFTGCAQLGTPGKVVMTPLTVVRDVVDVPHVTLTNLFDQGADALQPDAYFTSPGDWSVTANPVSNVIVDVGYFTMRGLSYGVGAITYVVCRSVYPNFPYGISPWVPEAERWTGDMYFPNTKALWE